MVCGVLEGRHTFAGKGGLFDLQRRRDEEPTVGRHHVAGLDEHNVARHDLARVDFDGLAVSSNPGDLLHHSLQGGQTGLRLGFLPQPHHRVEKGQQEQDEGGASVVRDKLVPDSGDNQDNLHEVLILAKECLPARLFFLC